MPLKIAFYKARPKGFFEWVVRIFAGKPTHCELVFSDGICFSSSPRDGGTRFKRIKFEFFRWDFIELPGEIDEALVRENAKKINDRPYGFLRAVLFFWPWLQKKLTASEQQKFYCSEAVIHVLPPLSYTSRMNGRTPKTLFDSLLRVVVYPSWLFTEEGWLARKKEVGTSETSWWEESWWEEPKKNSDSE